MDDAGELTLRLPADLRSRVDAIAAEFSRPATWVIERAVEAFVAVEAIEAALREADAGDFATDAEVEEVFERWQKRVNAR